ncbi:hypothetical protein ACJX0J_018428, partial [Zea mays]
GKYEHFHNKIFTSRHWFAATIPLPSLHFKFAIRAMVSRNTCLDLNMQKKRWELQEQEVPGGRDANESHNASQQFTECFEYLMFEYLLFEILGDMLSVEAINLQEKDFFGALGTYFMQPNICIWANLWDHLLLCSMDQLYVLKISIMRLHLNQSSVCIGASGYPVIIIKTGPISPFLFRIIGIPCESVFNIFSYSWNNAPSDNKQAFMYTSALLSIAIITGFFHIKWAGYSEFAGSSYGKHFSDIGLSTSICHLWIWY